MYKIVSFILLLLTFSQVYSQKGKPFIHNFPPYEYSGEDQVWTIGQNKNGVMYFGAQDGLHEYDGVNWNKFQINEDEPSILSMVFGDDNFLYIGSIGEIGYFKSNEVGKLNYYSLTNLLDSTDRLFTDVWSIAKSKQNIYFATDQALFRYNNSLEPKIKRISKTQIPFLIYNPNNEVFISFRDEGLFKIIGDELIPVIPKKYIHPWFMLPYKKNTYLVGNKDNSLSLLYFNENNLEGKIYNNKFQETEIHKTNNFFKENQLYTGATVINDSLFAIGTIRSGIAIVDKKGKLIETISKKENILSSTVHTLFSDNQGGLWAGLSYGISRIEYSSPFRIFDEKSGIPGTIYDITKYKNNLYASSNLGLFIYKKNHFEGIDAFTGKNSVQIFLPNIFHINDRNDSLFFVSSINGIYIINGTKAKKINSLSPNSFFQSEIDKSIFYCGIDYDLYTFSYENGKFTEPKKLFTFNGFLGNGVNFDKNNIWLILDGNPIIFNLKTKSIKNYKYRTELKNISINEISKQNNRILFFSNKGIYLFNKDKDYFYKDTSLFIKHFASKNIKQYSQISQNLSWALISNNLNSSLIKCSKYKNKVQLDSTPFKRLFKYQNYTEDSDSLLWVTSSKAIYKFDVNKKKEYNPQSLPIFTKIAIGKDSVIFNGNYLQKHNPLSKINRKFNYSLNNIAFEFALAEFDSQKLNEFKYILKGPKGNKVSNWTNKTYKEFSNLYEGKYVFMLKARNVYQKDTDYISFKFIVLSPWYRTWWAYLLYLIILTLLIYLIIKLNSRRLENENIRLDNIVKERTAEIYLQKEEIQTQADNLEEINTKLVDTNEEIKLIAENLKDANIKIQNKNNYITDSINYAKKIQKAILPSEDEISEILDKFFILYKPKDIVGGDFYFIKKIKTNIIIAAADCTGHGVPGGFLSMMGVSFLNEIVRKKNTKNPAQALDSLRQKFKHSLRQKNYFSSSIDGIDIALCVINTETGILDYAGANAPIIIIRNHEAIILKPDLQSIGIHFNEQKFTLKSFQLHINDTIYMFSDGFEDQFGGENNKKLLFKNFVKILTKYSTEPMKEQREKIIQSFNYWKRNTNQVDDILLIGFKVTKNLIPK